MIREISWYLDDGRFASLAQELESAVRAYAAARGGSPAEALRFREDARGLCERHCVQSGLRGAENSFINIDAEFFDGQKMNEAALEDFIRNIIKAHCYQKVLWTYMGTTGSLSPVTETQMRREGRHLESLFPLSCAPRGKSRRGRKAADNTVEMYLYADGKAGSGYIPEKAFHRFDVLEDTSGVNWSKGYDPAGTIARGGWHGAFDDGGVWVRVDETSAGTMREGKAPGEGREAGTLLVIRDGEHAILYDPENILVSPAALFYFTGAGEPYGRLDADLEKTAEEIRVAMKEMGLSRIKEIACTAAASPETLAAYRAVLKDHVSPAFVVTEAASLFSRIARIARIDKSRGSGGKRENRGGLPADVRAAGERSGLAPLPALAEDSSVRGRAVQAGTNLKACSKTHLKSGIWA
ncbi:MAG: hypothetical protein LBK44_05290, partial [Spirochaetales bacterium]|nr:hypothetical protein [Spirochaetales bacterium]